MNFDREREAFLAGDDAPILETLSRINFLKGQENLPNLNELRSSYGLKDKASRIVFTKFEELDEHMMNANFNAYMWRAIFYASKYERNPEVVKKAFEDITFPFLDSMNEIIPENKKILFVGCGSARDLQIALMAGFEAMGIDYSGEMIVLAAHFIAMQTQFNPNLAVMQMQEMASLNLPKNFGGIFLESALAHIPKSEHLKVINDCADLLDDGGLCLLGFRLTDSGLVYYIDEPDLGIRYFTSFTEEQAFKLIEDSGRFKILKVEYKDHPDPQRPRYLNMYLEKKKAA